MNLDRRLLAETRSVRLLLILTVAAGLFGAFATIIQAFLLARIVAAVFLEGGSLDTVSHSLALLLGVIAARSGLTWVREVSACRASGRIRASLRRRLLEQLFALGPSYILGERTGELSNTAVEGVESLDGYYSQYLPNLALAVMVPAIILIFVFPVDALSGVVLLLTAPLIPVFMLLIGKAAEALTQRQWESLSRMNAHFLDVLQGLSTLKLFNRSRIQGETIGRITARFRDTTLGVLRVAFLSALVLEITGSISTAIVAVEVGLRLLYSSIDFEQAFFILVLAPEFYQPLRALGASFHAGMSGTAAARRIYEVLGMEGIGERETGRRGDWESAGISPGLGGEIRDSSLITRPHFGSTHPLMPTLIQFRNVSLSYDSGDRPALKTVSFDMRAGETVALVGPSGAGKSSIAALLLGFLQPDSGEILVDGIPLHKIPVVEWRNSVAWVSQNPYLFAGTVLDNIRLGRPEASPEEVVHASVLAGADGFIRSLPRAYDTELGERAFGLSGGQAQRIALARAFLKNAPLLILDEPTAHLDLETEVAVQQSIERLSEGRTVLVIAHRFRTIEKAGRIVVLDDGAVREWGTHEELVAMPGLYAQMVAAIPPEGPNEELPIPHTGTTPPTNPPLLSLPTSILPFSPLRLTPSPLPLSPVTVLIRLLRLVAPYRWWMALAALLGFATVGAGVGLISTAAFLIASAALHPSVADLAVPIVGVRFFGVSRGIFRYLERYVSHNVTFRLLGKLRVWTYESLEPLLPSRLVNARSGDLLNRMVADVEALQHFYVRAIAPPLIAMMVGFTVWLFMSRFDQGLAFLLGLFLILGGVGIPLLVYWLGARPGAEVARARADLSAGIVESIQGLADILAFNGTGGRLKSLDSLDRRWLRLQDRLSQISGLQSALGVLVANAGSWAILAAAVPLVSAGHLAGVYLPVLALAALACFEAIAPLPLAAQQLGSSIEAARRLMELEQWKARTSDDTRDEVNGAGARERRNVRSRMEEHTQESFHLSPFTLHLSSAPALSIRDLRFRYSAGEPWVLDGVDLEVPEGRRVALVGPSGAGKSTILNLILRFWEYESGSIALMGRDLRSYSEEDVREIVAAVPQRIHLFNATIRDNLLLARPEASFEEFVQAAEHARLDGFVRTLPADYDTWVGEQGLKLSGGERQRVGIARALLRDAPLLVLDEPGTGLDSITERDVLETVWASLGRQGVLIITHSLAGLEEVDEIAVLHAGRVAERGSHRELLEAGGLYRRMWNLQHRSI